MGAEGGPGAGVDLERSPRTAAIEIAQAELRREFSVREERRRELEFLEKGGNPLDFKFGDTSTPFWPLQSDHLAEHLLCSDGKNSQLVPNGDSVESNVVCDELYPPRRVSEVVQKAAVDESDAASGRCESLSQEDNNDATSSRLRLSRKLVTHVDQEILRKEHDMSGSAHRAGYARRQRQRTNRVGNGPNTSRDSGKSLAEELLPSTTSSGIDIISHQPPSEARKCSPENEMDNKKRKILGFVEDKDCDGNVESALETSPKGDSSIQIGCLGPSDKSSLDMASNISTLKISGNERIGGVDLCEFDEKIAQRAMNKEEGNSAPSSVNFKPASDAGEVSSLKDTENGIALGFSLIGPVKAEDNSKDLVIMPMENHIISKKDSSAGVVPAVNSNPATSHDSVAQVVFETNISDMCSGSIKPLSFSAESTQKPLGLEGHQDLAACSLAKEAAAMKQDKRLTGSDEIKVKIEEGTSEGELGSSLLEERKSGLLIGAVVIPQPMMMHDVSKEESESGYFEGTCTGKAEAQLHGHAFDNVVTSSVKTPALALAWEKEKDLKVRDKASLPVAAKKAHEDFILEEAEVIKAAHKRNLEWSKRKASAEPSRRNSHWDFVLQEMAWMAVDFLQERLWKTAAAAQMARWIAEKRKREELLEMELVCLHRKIAHKMADVVAKYWKSVEVLLLKEKLGASQLNSSFKTEKTELHPMDIDGSATNEVSHQVLTSDVKNVTDKKYRPVQSYAVRLLKDSMNKQMVHPAEAPPTPDRSSEAGIWEPWEDQFPEESLYYIVPCGSMEAYCTSVEAHWSSYEAEHEHRLQEYRAVLEEAEIQATTEATEDSAGVSDYGLAYFAGDNKSFNSLSPTNRAFDADDDDTRMQYIPGSLDCAKGPISKKKRNKLFKTNPSKLTDRKPIVGLLNQSCDGNSVDNMSVLPSPSVTGKRTLPPSRVGSVGGGIPTKRRRTSAVTLRIRGPGLGSGAATTSAGPQLKSDISSGDTNSQQDDVNTFLDGSTSGRATDVESLGVLVKSELTEGVDSPMKNRKKKKLKHSSGVFSAAASSEMGNNPYLSKTGEAEQVWQKGLNCQNDQVKEQVKRKGEQLFHGSPGSEPAAGLVSTVASSHSTASNICNANKLIKQIANRDRSRKSKSGKVPPNQPGSGFPWSAYEDQAILAFVLELGPNWELVSDILSSNSQLKGIFRKPKDCKERHRLLEERLTGDGAESPEDSSSSQPYPLTSGLQKGNPKLLLQRMPGPIEEDTLRKHLGILVQLHQQLKASKSQANLREPKQLSSEHPSHATALSQAFQNTLVGAPLTPLDLIVNSTEATQQSYGMQPVCGGGLAYPGSWPTGLSIRPNSASSMLMSGSNGMQLGSGVVSPSAAMNAVAARDVQRLAAIRPICDEQLLHYNKMVTARGVASQGMGGTSGIPLAGLPNQATDCGTQILPPTSNNAGMMSRGMPMARAGYPGAGTSPIVSNINMSPPNNGGVITSGGAISAPLNMMRRRDSMSMAQGNPADYNNNTNNSTLVTSAIPSPSQGFSVQQQQNHHRQQQQYLMQVAAKERHLQSPAPPHHHLHQQQQQQQKRMLQQLPSAASLQPGQSHVALPSPSHIMPHQQLSPSNGLQQSVQSPSTPTLGSNVNSPQRSQALQQQMTAVGQSAQISAQLKQSPHQHPHQHPHQQRQQQLNKSHHHPHQQEQQQHGKTGKAAGRGAVLMQSCSGPPNSSIPGQLPLQLQGQSAQQGAIGQRIFPSQSSVCLDKPGATTTANPIQAMNLSQGLVAAATAATAHQKGLPQPGSGKNQHPNQLPLSTATIPNTGVTTTTTTTITATTTTNTSTTTSTTAPQSPPTVSLASQQQRRPTQHLSSQQQRRPQQRQVAGMGMSQQISHIPFQMGSMGSPGPLTPSSQLPLPMPLPGMAMAVPGTPWKPSLSPMPAGMYNLSRGSPPVNGSNGQQQSGSVHKMGSSANVRTAQSQSSQHQTPHMTVTGSLGGCQARPSSRMSNAPPMVSVGGGSSSPLNSSPGSVPMYSGGVQPRPTHPGHQSSGSMGSMASTSSGSANVVAVNTAMISPPPPKSPP